MSSTYNPRVANARTASTGEASHSSHDYINKYWHKYLIGLEAYGVSQAKDIILNITLFTCWLCSRSICTVRNRELHAYAHVWASVPNIRAARIHASFSTRTSYAWQHMASNKRMILYSTLHSCMFIWKALLIDRHKFPCRIPKTTAGTASISSTRSHRRLDVLSKSSSTSLSPFFVTLALHGSSIDGYLSPRVYGFVSDQ